MVIGSYFWGCLADTKGRKTVLIAALLMDGICGLLSSISQAYWLFMLLRFLNGFAVMAAALSLTFGRGGALLGNLIFGFLIDLNCVVPIALFASMLLGEYPRVKGRILVDFCAYCCQTRDKGHWIRVDSF
ncbi:hypothetical protein NQ318_007204 [Aromia moschata]|uniref:Major facilitator superfamily (MFS) profile domain-containing protein n=1 Tax=Aromia moschata TaxID=1265417 RepID=A0AAV8Y607_9CUCU|nr:hypothetical protein NQ318_007204 [Aromia moschata]